MPETQKTEENNQVTITFDKWKGIAIILAVAFIITLIFLFKDNKQNQVPDLNNIQQKQIQIDLNTIYKGDKDAQIKIVEYSDYQCPYCGLLYQELKQLDEEYIKTGKAVFYYKDFPLNIHPNAQFFATSARCANEQGKYWEVHNIIFENQENINPNNFNDHVKDILDQNKLNNCLKSNKYKDSIEADYNEGIRNGVTGTPTLFISKDGKSWEKIGGYVKYEQIKGVIENIE